MQNYKPSAHHSGPIMPRFLFKLKISAAAKVLYTLICDFAREKNYCWPSNKTLAENIPCGLTALKTYLQELVDQKLIKFDYRNGGSRVIHLLPIGDSLSTQPQSKIDMATPFYDNTLSESGIPQSKYDTPLSESDCPLSKSDTPPSKFDRPLSESDTKLNGNKLNTISSPSPFTANNPPVTINNSSQSGDGENLEGIDSEFEQFWAAYPRKYGKSDARETWRTLVAKRELPNLKHLLEKLSAFKISQDWQKENGRYIPYPAKFLNNRRWEDEPSVAQSIFTLSDTRQDYSNLPTPRLPFALENRNERIFQNNLHTANLVMQRMEKRGAFNVA